MADPAAKQAATTQLQRANEFASKAAQLGGIKVDSGTQAASGPAAGTEVGGFVFNGGNPNDRKNWERKGAAAASPASAPAPIDMDGIAFAGDGYKVNGQTYTTLSEAKAARDKARSGNNPMSRMLSNYGDD